MHKDSQNLKGALAALERLHPKKIDLGLERIERVLSALGNPHQSLPPTVHIAGTNGKGSTIAFLRAMAEAQDLSVHVYTSPHLVSFTERIVLAGKPVTEIALMDAIKDVLVANNDAPLSFFEATTAAAFLLFSRTPADLLILETGLGGRYDATNVITHPAVTAITPIDYDHAEFLGRDLAKIAREKAGIFKRYAPAFSGRQTEIVRAVLENEAGKLRVDLKILGEHFQAYTEQGRLVFEDDTALLDLPLPALRGQHQIDNAGLAIALARNLQISDEAIALGLGQAVWPARLQRIDHGPLANLTKNTEAELWLDGGHNPHAAGALACAMAELDTAAPKPLILIMGMLANKDAPGFLEHFKGLAKGLIAVPISGHASLSGENLVDMAKGRGLDAKSADILMDAVKTALSLDADHAPRILICGSLYLAGEVLSL
ncbi:MAG TPA: bifunctional folylpolyglutamate synthase/dihydrofolate synthase [Hellea balneolensis]|uniref:Dihydrofolate synthase/folylpolyglutamate synthase n=1 Tax=Hellea balneolensis TaxID=287478 RepID=A0A7C5LTM1_9PROT|nr:bifunctional folylpolyglutamate synthase/dihydrofolate synthase [Hellea balneolensis]